MANEDPEWYDDLPREEKDKIDQGLHWIIGLFSAFTIRALLIPIPFIGSATNIVAVFVREIFLSGKIERIGDTVKDSRVWLTGAFLGDLIASVYIPVWWTFSDIFALFS